MEDKSRTYYIPENFADGMIIAGKSVPFVNFLQGIILSGIAACAVFLLNQGRELSVLISHLLSIAVPLFIVCCSGIRGESLFGFIRSFVRHRCREGIYLYNPHIKKAARIRYQSQQPLLPRQQLMRLLGENKDIDSKTAGADQLYFNDDQPSEKPYQYMNIRERIVYRVKGKLIGNKKKREYVKVYDE